MKWNEFFKPPFKVVSKEDPRFIIDSEDKLLLEAKCASVMEVEPEENNLTKVRKQLLEEVADYLNTKPISRPTDYIPFGEEWAKEMSKFPKAEIIKMLGKSLKENKNIKTVMIAAAEEIQDHWEAHCDREGYGPSNLMLRLERGLAEDYVGYSAGAFRRLLKQCEYLTGEHEIIKQQAEEWKKRAESADKLAESAQHLFDMKNKKGSTNVLKNAWNILAGSLWDYKNLK